MMSRGMYTRMIKANPTIKKHNLNQQIEKQLKGFTVWNVTNYGLCYSILNIYEKGNMFKCKSNQKNLLTAYLLTYFKLIGRC